MTAWNLFYHMAAIAAGLFLIGLSVFLVCCLFVGVIGWAKRPAPEPSIKPVAPASPSTNAQTIFRPVSDDA